MSGYDPILKFKTHAANLISQGTFLSRDVSETEVFWKTEFKTPWNLVIYHSLKKTCNQNHPISPSECQTLDLLFCHVSIQAAVAFFEQNNTKLAATQLFLLNEECDRFTSIYSVQLPSWIVRSFWACPIFFWKISSKRDALRSWKLASYFKDLHTISLPIIWSLLSWKVHCYASHLSYHQIFDTFKSKIWF